MERITEIKETLELIDDLVSKGYKYRSSRTDENLIADVKKDITSTLSKGEDSLTIYGTQYIHHYFVTIFENEKEFQFSTKVVKL